MSSTIKVFLVEDSRVALTILKRLLAKAPDLEVVGTATDGEEALAQIPRLQPHVICTDLQMRGMDGLALTQAVMAQHPTPILVISNSVHPEDGQQIFDLLQAGAVDVFPKPSAGTLDDYQQVQQDLLTKIRVLAGVKVFARRSLRLSNPSLGGSQLAPAAVYPLASHPNVRTIPTHPPLGSGSLPSGWIRAIAIGASTGGPQALSQVLQGLSRHLTVPVFCTQHISPGFLAGLVSWLKTQCALPIQVATPGELPQAGTVYFAPEGHHLGMNTQGRLIYLDDSTNTGHCPAVTVMFDSLTQFYGRFLAGVLLTGMGRDGALGLQTIAQNQGLTIAQDESSCVVFGMPKAAIDLNAAQTVLPIDQIAAFLLPKLRHRPSGSSLV